MGKVGKRQPQKHSNHHDNPHRNGKAVVRRQHSQNAFKKLKTNISGKVGRSESNSKPTKTNTQVKLNVPFSRWDRVLLVGEGDFSFTLALISNHPVANVVATCFDSKDALEKKYPGVKKTTQKLATDDAQTGVNAESEDPHFPSDKEEIWKGFSPSASSDGDHDETANKESAKVPKNCTILYRIDATKLSTTHKKVLKSHAPFTKIVFNFPHVGGLSTDVNRQVRSNQQLLVEFFNAAKMLLATTANPAKLPQLEGDDGGEEEDYDNDATAEYIRYLKHGQILVTLFEGEPYTLWNIRDLARHSGLKVLESFKFPWVAYPGYRHARTIGDVTSGKDRSDEGKRRGAWRGEERDARCYVLALKDDDSGPPGPGSRKRKRHDDDSD